MKTTWNIFSFVFIDNLRSAWALAYLLFMAISTWALIYFTGSFTRAAHSIMNIVILITPLVSTMMASMYYFNKTDFLYLLLAQPVRRTQAFMGLYLGMAITLCLSVGLGLLAGILIAGISVEDASLAMLIVATGMWLSVIFSAVSLWISVAARDKLKGVGLALFTWLFMAVIYDGLLLWYFVAFSEYPIEHHAIGLSMLNPIDLCRIFIMLRLDISALMGFSGAVFQSFFGQTGGMLVAAAALTLWTIIPVALLIRQAKRKDY